MCTSLVAHTLFARSRRFGVELLIAYSIVYLIVSVQCALRLNVVHGAVISEVVIYHLGLSKKRGLKISNVC